MGGCLNGPNKDVHESVIQPQYTHHEIMCERKQCQGVRVRVLNVDIKSVLTKKKPSLMETCFSCCQLPPPPYSPDLQITLSLDVFPTICCVLRVVFLASELDMGPGGRVSPEIRSVLRRKAS